MSDDNRNIPANKDFLDSCGCALIILAAGISTALIIWAMTYD